jgi:uncharacterized delta-60 repeat protein
MEFRKTSLVWLIPIGAILFAGNAFGVTNWTFSIPPASSGAFTSSESTTSSTVLGTYSRLANGFIEMTVTGGSGANIPSNGTIKHALEIPGFAFFSQPMLTTEKRIISTVSVGACPTTSFTGILGYSIWAGTAGTSTDVSSAAMPTFGVFSWDPGTNLATISDLRNLTSYGTLAGFASFSLAGSCSNGVITFSGPGDRGGSFYVTNTQGGVYVTNTNRLMLVLPQKSIPAASRLNDTYAVFDYDESFHTNTWPSRITIAGGTTGTGDRITNITAGTADTSQSWSMSNITINNPINGVFTTDISLEGGATRTCACATYFRNKTTIFCVAQSPYDVARPMNFIMVSDNQAFAGGTLDTYGFGTGINVTTYAGGNEWTYALALQSDGKIVVAGYDRQDFGAQRLLADGTLDTSFSSDGKVVTNILAGAIDRAFGMAIDSQNRVVLGGYAVNANDDFALLRYSSDGTLDNTFDTDGRLISTISATTSERIQEVAIDAGDRIVVAGYASNGTDNDFITARYTTAGVLDTTFSTDGFDLQNIGGAGADQAMAVVIQTNGMIVVGGFNGGNFALVRYTTAGALDANFSGDGIQNVNFGGTDRANALALQTDGKILIGGYAPLSGFDDFAIARLLSDGTLDNTFDSDGRVTTTFSTTAADRVESMAVFTDGGIVAVGWVNDGVSDNIAIAKYTSAGALDTGFDGDGMYTYDHAGGQDRAQSVAVQYDEKIVVGGLVTNTNDDLVVMRFWP